MKVKPQKTDSYSAEGDASSEDIARRLKLDKGLGPSCVCCMKLVAEPAADDADRG